MVPSESSSLKTCVVLFSGGVDSTYVVVKNIEKFDRMILLTYDVPGMIWVENSKKSFEQLIRAFGDKVRHEIVNLRDFIYARRGGVKQCIKDNWKYRFFYSWCLGCKSCMHLYTIRYCRENNIKHVIDGSNFYDVHALEQHSDVKSLLTSVYATNDIQFDSPDYYEEEIKHSKGIVAFVLKQLSLLRDSTEFRASFLQSRGIHLKKWFLSKYLSTQPSCTVSMLFNIVRLPLKFIFKEPRGCCYLHHGYLNYITDVVFSRADGLKKTVQVSQGEALRVEKEVYLDNAATTRLDPDVAEFMRPFQAKLYGNASAMHAMGRDADKAIEKARKTIAEEINAEPDEIVFTSGGTESNNLAIKGIAFAHPEKGRHIVASCVEHPSVREAVSWLEKQGYDVTWVQVDSEGLVDPTEVEREIRRDTVLVSVMHVQNEIGTLQPIGEIGKICREKNVFFHTDACQSFTKSPLDVKRQNLDMVSMSAHKLHGPKGIGALYHRRELNVDPLLHGGGQEGNLRSGTYATESIAGFGRAVEIVSAEETKRMQELGDYCIIRLQERIDGVRLNGSKKQRLGNIISVMIDGVSGKRICSRLDETGIYLSTGSACSSRVLTPSRTLLALGYSQEEAMQVIRISLSKWTTKEEIDIFSENLALIVAGERSGPDAPTR